MALIFFNIRTKERLVGDSEPKIAALWGSSDRSPNAQQGQDFGWRLAPPIIVELKRIKRDPAMIAHICALFNKPVDELNEYDILMYISSKSTGDSAELPVADLDDYEDEYNMEIRRLERLGSAPVSAPSEEPVDLETLKRGELNEMALKLGIKEPQMLPNRDTVIAAIETAQLDAEV